MKSRLIVIPVFLLVLVMMCASSSRAYWIDNGVGIATSTNDEGSPHTTTDGSGGAIIAYSASSGSMVRASRIDGGGTVLWDVYVAGGLDSWDCREIVSDRTGGAIVIYRFSNLYGSGFFAQRVDGDGNILWDPGGISLGSGNLFFRFSSDGAGGIIFAWSTYVAPKTPGDIYAQRLDADGNVLWTGGGVAVCTATGSQGAPDIVSDGAGGAMISWSDDRGPDSDIYAQRLDATGSALWAADGIPVCAATGSQGDSHIVLDLAGGVIVSWSDSRGADSDIYAQRLDSSGNALWTLDGVSLCAAAGDQGTIAAVSDGAGGAVIDWRDTRNSNYYDIYAQRVDSTGTSFWTTDGVAVRMDPSSGYTGDIINNQPGGSIITWYDYRDGDPHIYSQMLDDSGNCRWEVNGVPVCNAAGGQYAPLMVSDGKDGAIIAWRDERTGDSDVYAQHMDSRGRTGFLGPTILSVADVPEDQGGWVELSFSGGRGDVYGDTITVYTVWRALSTSEAMTMLNSGEGRLVGDSGRPAAFRPSIQPLRADMIGEALHYWELVDSIQASHLPVYSDLLQTAFDSTSVCDEYHYFQVLAHAGLSYFASDPDSGRSVDNLAPAVPSGIGGEANTAPAGVRIFWDPNTEADIWRYAVYRGETSDFEPSPENLVGMTSDTTLIDAYYLWTLAYYKITAIDIHRNESDEVLFDPSTATTGTEDPHGPDATFLGQNYPNPFNPTTQIGFGLERKCEISLEVYDAAGRLVRVIFRGVRPAGRYVESWDGKDDSGNSVESGVYFCRLATGSRNWSKKMVLLR
jgi:hypothetical protein